jgi:formamidopyrimidine-DNA glycosylase
MPELPEVETTRRGAAPLLSGRTVTRVVIRHAGLRWRVSGALARDLPGETIRAVRRRAKYLLLDTDRGSVIIHLGMSGSLRVIPASVTPGKFDHVDIVLDDGKALRLRDPRRFGAVLWTRDDPMRHRLLRDLGPEPLTGDLSATYLFALSRGRRRAIRDFLLDGHVVAGIGNIYANESLFDAGIRPTRPAGRLSLPQYRNLVRALRTTLRRAIKAGGTTLRDFQRTDGEPGYFQLRLRVYGRAGQPCRRCGRMVKSVRLGQRSAFYCPACQP